MRVGFAPAALFAITTLASARASADPAAGIHVGVEGCALDAGELERLVRLELVSVLGPEASGSYDVAIRCQSEELTIALYDPLTAKKIERVVALPPPSQSERERLVALAVAQLYRAAWLELVAHDPPPLSAPDATRPKAAPREVEGAKGAAARVVRRVAPTQTLSIALLGGAVGRALESPLVFPEAEVEVAFVLEHKLRLGVYGGLEWASIGRLTGVVDTLLGRAGAIAGFEPLSLGAWSGFVEAAGGVGYGRLSGSSAKAPYREGTVSGAGFDGAIGVGAAARVGPIRFEIVARLGMLVGTPTGWVAGDDDVSLDGVWAGGALRLRGLIPL